MTAPETIAETTLSTSSLKPSGALNGSGARRLLVFGTNAGIAIGPKNLEAVIVRSRASGPAIIAATTIHDFRNRQASDWGGELQAFLIAAREKNLPATLLLPRDEVIVRSLQLPGVTDKDVASAIALQIDTLHPFGDAEVVCGWSRTGPATIVVGVARRESLDSYETLFSEAGILVSGVTFSASAIYAALRIWSGAPASLLLFMPDERGRIEVYGESAAKALYSAEFSLTPERALAVARGELRLESNFTAQALAEVLPRSKQSHAAYSALAYAAALAASAPLVTKFANLLPAERRASNARKQYLLPVILAVLLIVGCIVALVVLPAIEKRKYLQGLNAEVRGLEPQAALAQSLDRRIKADRVKIGALDDFKRRSQADLDVLNELTRILPAQVWTNSIEIYTDNVVLSGEADHSEPLLKVLDSSPLFQDSELVTHNSAGQAEQFRIKTMRRNRIGRTTP